MQPLIRSLPVIGSIIVLMRVKETEKWQRVESAIARQGSPLFLLFSLWLPEQFETRVRATAFAFCTSIGRFVGAGVNFTLGALVLNMKTLGVPIALTSIVFLLGLLIIPLAPETKGRVLPQ